MNVLILLNNSRIGKCAHCMRAAAGIALAASALAATAALINAPQYATVILMLVAVTLTLNWLTNIVAFTYRNRQKPDPIVISRRAALAWTVKAAMIGFAASIPVATLSTKALAFCGQCTQNADCGVGFSCKNTAAVNEGKVCNECVAD